ncbi:GrpB family protein [Macrococcoides caseolyticum]|uniref:GrpB family protein n=1 Tax=Macrococcoides caseolyticum TaxID=69966 RepID=UPI001F21F35E|nr:GrpB family protein [Macrococcus caseolyticus]MCE4955863.1 GrpB family protein [Macrococcus caseolyticus]
MIIIQRYHAVYVKGYHLMLKQKPELTINNNVEQYAESFHDINHMLLTLLDTPIIKTYHIGSTAVRGALTSGIIDVLVVVNSLHAMTTLDEKRLNLQKYYRLHHPYDKKCVYAKFENLKTLNEIVRLHIVEKDSKKLQKYIDGQTILIEQYESFNAFKSNLNHEISVKEYEKFKSDWFNRHLSV